ncbi:hypothetical protein [Sulfolobus acidocaldarius]|uniref:Uncharacterized protein n=4 Tax=Sulfolobus acidocaldarius TaxID=2285 RepID=Q4JA18_SULAC|nr:hypothetical protein [Sulfolobus acidocaldarius]AAY80362.1 hypothetical protein Saci_1004 [Sulfolobus acidocaldarius DSM 639]AGE70945.1 hypothetical protein SacN8_04870 [Sulfolobus acidocaldarius N8]AGE73216.1 hypothetical protein SacRon12I_04860 [Sulfolobus acidocaldarius Ron12/I]ALU28750.1 hypothetical protein ATY89_01435 [Sulfolobus acidocaldarius]ALU31470.1 hypothetical protein ATZ20_04470 [Sulfolobus acidocaldarius]
MNHLIVVTLTEGEIENNKEKLSNILKKLRVNDELILLSKLDVSYMFKGYKIVEKNKDDEEGIWILRVKKN